MLPSVVAHLLQYGRGAGHLAPRRPARLGGGEPAGDVRVGGLLEVVPHLIIQVPIGGVAIGQNAQAVSYVPPEGHRAYPSALRSRATADARRIQLAVSSSSRFRPTRVRV